MPRRINRTGYTEADKLRRHQRIIIDLGLLATQSMPLEQFLRHAVSQVALALEVTNTKIMRYRPEEGDLLLVQGVGWHEGVVGQATFPIDLRSVAGRSFQTADPIVVDDISDNEEFTASRSLAEHGIVSVANVPILIDKAAWGVLEADHTERRDFRQDTVDFLLAVSRLAAIVIQRHQAEEAHRNAVAEASKESQRRDLLLTEMQHRVKNYFQMILSMVSLERSKLPSQAGRDIMGKVAERIMAVSLGNDQLSPRQGRHTIDMPTYLRAICTGLASQRDDVSITVKADEIALPSERAVPIGLIVNELVTNSLKYAFNGGPSGSVIVELTAGAGGGRAMLQVTDDGSGIREGAAAGTGTRLLQSLVRQVAGEMDQTSSTKGTMTSVIFIDTQ
jgi:two-component system, sensor histidine kinase PdtaS